MNGSSLGCMDVCVHVIGCLYEIIYIEICSLRWFDHIVMFTLFLVLQSKRMVFLPIAKAACAGLEIWLVGLRSEGWSEVLQLLTRDILSGFKELSAGPTVQCEHVSESTGLIL